MCQSERIGPLSLPQPQHQIAAIRDQCRETPSFIDRLRSEASVTMIERFLYVATMPDPRLALILGAGKEASKYKHLMRYPYWPYWGPLISVLQEKRIETAKLVPNEAAKVCAMWLRSMNFTPKPNYKIVWRQEAAELAYAIAGERHFLLSSTTSTAFLIL
jgi:hypothetical protein